MHTEPRMHRRIERHAAGCKDRHRCRYRVGWCCLSQQVNRQRSQAEPLLKVLRGCVPTTTMLISERHTEFRTDLAFLCWADLRCNVDCHTCTCSYARERDPQHASYSTPRSQTIATKVCCCRLQARTIYFAPVRKPVGTHQQKLSSRSASKQI